MLVFVLLQLLCASHSFVTRPPPVSPIRVPLHGARTLQPRSFAVSGVSMEETQIPDLTQHPPRRVAILVEPSPFTHISGYSNRFRELLRYLTQAGDTSMVITPDRTESPPQEIFGNEIVNIKGFRWPLYKSVVVSMDTWLRGWRALKRFRPDIIHVSAPGFLQLKAVIYAWLLRVPVVVSYHTHVVQYARNYGYGWTVPFLRLVLRLCLNACSLVITTSPQLKEHLMEECGVRDVRVWRKGVDTLVFSPEFNKDNSAMRVRLTDQQPHKQLLLYVGRLGVEKQIDHIRDVLNTVENTHLAVVGEGPAEQDLREHFKGSSCTFMGSLTGEQLSRAFAAADVFVMPSESETLGFVAMEAMASGVPVVAAKAGGLINIVKDGKTGYLYSPGDKTELVDKVSCILQSEEVRSSMKAESRLEAQKWDWKSATSVIRNVEYLRAEGNYKAKKRKLFGIL